MMLILISEAISNSNAVIRREFRKLRFQMIDDTQLGVKVRGIRHVVSVLAARTGFARGVTHRYA